MTGASDERHLSAASFAAYVADALPYKHPIPGTPRLHLFIDPDARTIGLRGPQWEGDAPDPVLRYVETRTVAVDGEYYGEIVITDTRLFTEAYPFLCTVADRIQESGYTMARALRESLKQFSRLLQGPDRLSSEDEVGLVGELLVLRGLSETADPASAVAAWQGGASEEHDFSLGRDELEVKTTRSEKRTHWISSATQLVPNPGRPLWIASLQVTGGGVDGFTLPTLIHEIRALMGTDQVRADLERRLNQYGWDDSFAEVTRSRWRLRSIPGLFAVEGGFPRITPEALAAGGVNHSYIPHLTYQIDLSGFGEALDPPGHLLNALRAAAREDA